MENNTIAGAYLAKGIIGNTKLAGSPIVHFALVVVPSQHKVGGSIEITQATLGGGYTGTVNGTIYATGFGDVTQIVALNGTIHSLNPQPIEIPFEAHLAINGAWIGKGGFQYANVHIEDVPVIPEK